MEFLNQSAQLIPSEINLIIIIILAVLILYGIIKKVFKLALFATIAAAIYLFLKYQGIL